LPDSVGRISALFQKKAVTNHQTRSNTAFN